MPLLELQLHEHYWLHQEYFPSHRNLPANCAEDLVATLTHSIIGGTFVPCI
jgi:hypothetical protein